jgi:hypothetical protein
LLSLMSRWTTPFEGVMNPKFLMDNFIYRPHSAFAECAYYAIRAEKISFHAATADCLIIFKITFH